MSDGSADSPVTRPGQVDASRERLGVDEAGESLQPVHDARPIAVEEVAVGGVEPSGLYGGGDWGEPPLFAGHGDPPPPPGPPGDPPRRTPARRPRGGST